MYLFLFGIIFILVGIYIWYIQDLKRETTSLT
jgi:hypothetical protein